MTITIRNFRQDDIPALVPLWVAVEEVDHLGLAITENEIRQVFANPTLRPEENTFVAQTDKDQMVGTATLQVFWGDEVVFVLHGCVHPAWRRRGIGQRLLQATIARAHERRGDAAGRRAWLQIENVRDQDAGRTALAEANGFHVARWEVDMRRELPGLGKVAPLIPVLEELPGIQLRKWRAGVDDEEVGHMFNEAFRDHWGDVEIQIEDWLHIVRTGHIQTEHSVLAWDVVNDRLIGACANGCDEHTFRQRGRRELYVEVLGVRREYRKRGVATALLTWTLHRASHLEMQSVGLDADAENLTGAVRLYTRLGV